MPEASSRLLVDRSTIRVDGRPFFTFGPNILLTPPARLDEACREIAAAGFTAVGSMPVSPGTVPLVDALFDAAERHGLFVVLNADRRQTTHGPYLAQHFRHRPNLHSYNLPWIDGFEDMRERYLRERDEIRSVDLFHPIWSALGRARPGASWLRSMDLYAVAQEPWSAASPTAPVPAAERLAEVARLCRPPFTPRPLFCSSLPVAVADADRAAGLFDDDPEVQNTPREALHMFPAYSLYDDVLRRDWMPPDPALLRMRVFELLAAGVRGIMLDYHEAMLGTQHCSGRDRLAEASILAQEIAIFREFFAEGRPDLCLVEAGHPRLRAAVLRHGEDHLILVRAVHEEDSGTAGESHFLRAEIDIRPEGTRSWNGWRVDFPAAHQIPVTTDSMHSLRLQCGSIDTTAVLLLTPGRARAHEISAAIQERLPLVARQAVAGLTALLTKVHAIEEELQSGGHGDRQPEHMGAAIEALEAAHAALARGGHADAYNSARLGQRELRAIMRIQEARAKAEPILEADSRRLLMRRSYYTLPYFYRDKARESKSVFLEFT